MYLLNLEIIKEKNYKTFDITCTLLSPLTRDWSFGMFLWREKKHLDILPVKWTPKWPSSSWRVWHLLAWFWVYFLQCAIPKTSSSDSVLGPQTVFFPQRLHVLPQQAPVWQLLSPLCHSSPLWSTWSALMCVLRYSWIYVFLEEKKPHT